MARASSENPRDVANLERLTTELRDVMGEAQRLLELAAQQSKENALETSRARADRQAAASETRARRAVVGKGATPVGTTTTPAATAAEQVEAARATEESAGAAERAVKAEAARLAAARELVGVEKQETAQLAEQVRLATEAAAARERAARTPATAGYAANVQAVVAQEEAARVAAQNSAAYDQRIQAQESARSAAAARYAVDNAARGRGPLLLGAGPSPAVAPQIAPATPIKLSEATRAARGFSDAEEAMIARAKAATYAEDGLSQSIAYNSRVIGLASNAYQKHGYLTSEFIQAAAKGQVTFRELGQQVGGTIAKFAGWTAAASAVYGALGAVKELGKGAIDSSNGVQLLNRVIDQTKRGGISNDNLRDRVSNLAGFANVPIDEANQAVYGSLKAFRGDLPQALDAAKEALFGVKVGELSAADSTRYLTSIVQGFQLTAKDLPLLFDTINQAQNRFGGSSAAMTAGVAKAAGAFRLANNGIADYRTLISLLQAGSRLTGRTPDAVATAVQRSAGRVLTAPGRTALQAAGLNPDQSYTQLIAQASHLAQGASNARVEQLARALVPQGGTYAAIFAPLLQNSKLVGQIYDQISPDKSKGSAARELARVLREPGEQLKQIAVDAQRLGVELAKLGAGAGPGLLLHTLHDVLGLARELLGTFNSIANIGGPFKPYITGGLEFLAVLKLLRRFDVGDRLPTGRGGPIYEGFTNTLRRNPVAAERAQALQGLSDQQKFALDERSRAAVSAGSLGTQRELAYRRAFAAKQTGTDEEILASQREFEATSRQYARAVELEEVYRAEALSTQEQINAVQAAKVKTTADLHKLLVSQQVYFTNPTLDRPFPVGPQRVPGAPGAPRGAPPVILGPNGEPVGPADRVVANEAEANRAQRGLASLKGRLDSLATRAESMSGISGRAATAVGVLGSGVVRFGTTSERVASSLAASAAKMNESMGPLGKGLAGLAAAYFVYNAISKNVGEANDQIRRVAGGTGAGLGAAANYRTQSALSNAPLVGHHGLFGSAGGLFNNAADAIASGASGLLGGSGLQTDDQIKEELARHAKAELDSLNAARKKHVDLYQYEIQANLKANLGRAGNDRGAQEAAINQALKEEAASYANSIYGTQATRASAAAITQGIKDQLSALHAAHGELQAALAAISDAKGLDTFNKAVQGRYDVGDAGVHQTARAFGFSAARARALFGQTGDPAEQAALASQIGVADQGQEKALTDQLNRRLAQTSNVAANNAARRSFTTQLTEARLGPLRASISELEADTKQFPDHARKNSQAIAELRKGLNFESQQINATILEQRNASFDAAQKLYDAQTAQQATLANDPVASLRIHLQRDIARLAALAQRYGKGSAEYVQALTNAASERQQLVSAAIQQYSSIQNLSVARDTVGATDQVKNQASLQAARNVLAFAQSHGGSAEEIRNAALAVYQAEDAMTSQIKQRTQDLLDAQRTLALSTLDPSDKVAADRVNLHYDRLALAQATNPADRLKAQAAINTDIQNQRNDRLGARASLIDFQLGMQQIDSATASAEYDALARRVKNNKDLYRQYKLKAHELLTQTQGQDYALDIANVKIPTPYEVTRAIKEGRQATQQYRASVVNNQRTNIRIEVRDNADLAKVGDVLDTHLNTTTRSALRARGVV